MRIIKNYLNKAKRLAEGNSSYIIKDGVLEKIYGRKNLILKVFKAPVKNLGVAWWGNRLYKPKVCQLGGKCCDDFKLIENTIVQNLAAFKGYAPRVYDLIIVEDRKTHLQYAAQVTERIKGRLWTELDELGKDIPVLEDLEDFIRDQRIYTRDIDHRNIFGDKFFDFDGFGLPGCYEDNLKKRAHEHAHFARAGDPAYQTIDKIMLEGMRDSRTQGYGDYRRDALKLDLIDFKDKRVLDVGCNLGLYCMEADLRGAKRVIGIDLPETAKVGREIVNYLNHFNVDILGIDLLKEGYEKVPFQEFDVVFYMAMLTHLEHKIDDKLMDMCKEVMIFESHVGGDKQWYDTYLREKFRDVVFIGEFSDKMGMRYQYHCWK